MSNAVWMNRATAIAAAFAALGAGLGAPANAASVRVENGYLRVVEDPGRSIALEVASRQFVPADGRGPRVALVGVAHIGLREFYRKLQAHLDGFDVVLYESVMPPGSKGPGGETPLERASSTRAAMEFVAGLVTAHRRRTGGYPMSLTALAGALEERDARLARWLEAASVDAWGKPLSYEVHDVAHEAAAPVDAAGGFRLTSLGADGSAGGDGADADLVVSSSDGVRPFEVSEVTRLQSSLAQALGLEFQLSAIDYGGEGWQPSDMAMDEMDRALAERGAALDMAVPVMVGDLPEGVVRFLLGAIRMLDTILGGAITDTFKVLLIELLGDESLVEDSLKQLGPGLTEVIVDMRNQVVIDDLARLKAQADAPSSVAIFYGAAHMKDLEQRLKQQLGYQEAPTGSAGAVQWHRAMEVDLRQSAVSPEQLEQLRATVRQMMRGGR